MKLMIMIYIVLSDVLLYDVDSGSEITPCNKIYIPLVVYRFSGNVIKSIQYTKIITF